MEIPQIRHFTDRDVEYSAGKLTVIQTFSDHLYRLRIAFDRLSARLIDPVNIGALFGTAEQRFVAAAQFKGLFDRFNGGLLTHPFHVVDGYGADRVKIETLPYYRLLFFGGASRLCYENDCGQK